MAEREGWVLVDVFVVVDEDGGSAVSSTGEAEAFESYQTDIGAEGVALRVVAVKLWVELPKTATLTGEAALTGQGAELVVG